MSEQLLPLQKGEDGVYWSWAGEDVGGGVSNAYILLGVWVTGVYAFVKTMQWHPRGACISLNVVSPLNMIGDMLSSCEV